ncbi:immunoglobulin superfamily member 5 isoform X2 [Esox lucius]|uniref:immunoglobulin superfamily member 5 isoform X2 n=1 Tax=Esox lucius TaxID=8010 RepID=UPI00147770E6|nr:immunoglobulin superfamily member 5 isoform X2 [Esox lucius]
MGSPFFKLLLLYSSGVLGGPTLEPLNATVLQGSKARFNVSLSESWVSMTWSLKNVLVLTITKQGVVLPHESRFHAENYSSADTHRWEFIIQNVWRNDSGPVSCNIQNLPTLTALLSVQVNGSVNIVGGNLTMAQGHLAVLRCEASGWFPKPTVNWELDGALQNSSNTTSEALNGLYNSTSLLTVRAVNSVPVMCLASVSTLTTPQSNLIYLLVEPQNWTVLIAIVCSIGGLALLVLLILGILFCCKRRNDAKSRYQEEMRRTMPSVSGGVAAPNNLTYVGGGNTPSVTPSEFNDSGYSQTKVSNIFEIPDIVNSNQAPNCHVSPYNTLEGTGVRKHRHVTIV